MGFLLMQKMGWSSGVGLGKNEQGIIVLCCNSNWENNGQVELIQYH